MAELVQVVILIGGGAPVAPPQVATGSIVIAADGGLTLAAPLGLHVDCVIGDLDSVDARDLAHAEQAGATIEVHPADKDRTDLELSLARAVAIGAHRITVIGGAAGRGDHHLANVAVLTAPALASADVVAHLGATLVTVVRSEATVHGAAGSNVSLLAAGAPVYGVTTSGLRWPLYDEDLAPWSARGVSNELVDTQAVLTVRDGTLLAIQPVADPQTDPLRGAPR